MVSTEFAPNERWTDAVAALSMLNQPWRWKKGNALHKLKHRMKKFFPGHELFFFMTGRAALHRLLKTMRLKRGDEILVQGFTCAAVPLPILALKLKPIYVDINRDDFSMDFYDLKKKLTPSSRVIILQHTFGITPKYRLAILNLAKECRITVIEDLAHGFDEKIFKNSESESIKLLSFGRSKYLSSVFGGMIALKNREIAKDLKSNEKTLKFPAISFIYRTLTYKALAPLIRATYDYKIGKAFHKICTITGLFPPEITVKEKRGEYDSSYEKAYPNVFAYFLLKQIKFIDQKLKKRHEILDIYETCFHTFEGKVPYHISRYPAFVENRGILLKNLSKLRVFLGKWYDRPVAPKEVPLEKVRYREGECPSAERICEKIINLPVNIKESQAARILNLIKDHE